MNNGPVFCQDGSLDMRFNINKQYAGLQTGQKLDGSPDMRFNINKKMNPKYAHLFI